MKDGNAVEWRGDPIRLGVVDDQELFRRGLVMLLEAAEGIDVVGEATDGLEAAAMAERAAPDIILMDVNMPRLSGIESCRAIKDVAPSVKIIMLATSGEETDVCEAVKNGASGYLLKSSSIEQVSQAIRLVADGQSLISPR
ncbi:MAG: response regulator [Nocardioidaceae bacterium]